MENMERRATNKKGNRHGRHSFWGDMGRAKSSVSFNWNNNPTITVRFTVCQQTGEQVSRPADKGRAPRASGPQARAAPPRQPPKGSQPAGGRRTNSETDIPRLAPGRTSRMTPRDPERGGLRWVARKAAR
eukprot:EG_transcript_24408